MKICKNCSAQLDDNMKFCANCGAKYEEIPAEPVEETVEEAVQETVEEAAEVVEAEFEEAAEETAEETVETAEEAVEETVEEAEIAEEAVQEAADETNEVVEQQATTEAEGFVPPIEENDALEAATAEFTVVNAAQFAAEQAAAPDPQMYAPTPAPEPVLSKKQLKEREKMMQEAAKQAAKDAERQAKLDAKEFIRQSKLAAKAEKKSRKNRITFFGVVCAILLVLFLIVNLSIAYVASVGAGIASTDLRGYVINIDGEEYSLDSILDSAKQFEDNDMLQLLEAISENPHVNPIITVDGVDYELAIEQSTLDMINEIVEENEAVYNMILDGVGTIQGFLYIAFLVILGFVGVVSVVLIASIVVSLSKRRGALMVPGLVLVIFGVVFLAASVVAMAAPTVLFIDLALFTAPNVAVFSLATPGVMAFFGIMLTIIGATGRKKA